MKRVLDFTISLFAILLLSVPMSIIAVLVKLTSKGPVFYWSDRIGQHNQIFRMPKFRTMQIDTPVVATHLLENPDHFLIAVGKFLRKSSLDELPQLLSIIKGDMSFVGPRPALFNQNDLIDLRTQKGVQKLTPGLTGWAQINGRDELSVKEKVEYDVYYLNNHSLLFDLKIIQKTILQILRYEGICH